MGKHHQFCYLLLIIVMILSGAGCSENAFTSVTDQALQTKLSNRSISNIVVKNDKLITSDPARFTRELKELDNNNEVLIVLKNTNAPRISKEILLKIPGGGNSLIALPKAPVSTTRRATPGFGRLNSQSRQSVKHMLKANNITKLHAPDYGNVITAELPAERVQSVVKALLNNPNIDYIEANRSYAVQFSTPPIPLLSSLPSFAKSNSSIFLSNPQGSNPSDQKHTFHNVLEAWDYTRGSGARIGILDSGFSYDQGANSYHQDGQLFSSTKGIKKLGFVDDYDNSGNCNGGSGQPYGDCIGWDDHGHGTYMAGLTGSNDNNQGYVGIMPEGLTISMKITQNCYITQACSGGAYAIQSDDFYWAVEWARNNNLDVLSMSFSSTGISSTVYNALYDAYYSNDILLLSATGNEGDPAGYSYPQIYNFVLGVGGLESDGTSYGIDKFEDLSAISNGGTLGLYCPSNQSFCTPNGFRFFNFADGGTSTSTAIVAGIAGLIRSNEPGLSAMQVLQRLIDTSVGANNRVDALRAVTNDILLSILIDGPALINSSGIYSWEAIILEGGDGNYNYLWEYRHASNGTWQTVGHNKVYSRSVSTDGQSFILRLTVTSGDEEMSISRNVETTNEDCPGQWVCS